MTTPMRRTSDIGDSDKWWKLAPLAAAVVDDLHIPFPDGGTLGEGDVAKMEHLIHEVAHAVSLGYLPFGFGTALKVEEALDHHEDNGVREEEKTWAIEWFCWQHYGLDGLFSWGDLVAGAESQGCDVDAIHQLIFDNEDHLTDDIYQFHLETVSEIGRLVAKELQKKGK